MPEEDPLDAFMESISSEVVDQKPIDSAVNQDDDELMSNVITADDVMQSGMQDNESLEEAEGGMSDDDEFHK